MFILRILNFIALYTPLAKPPESIESGNYGQNYGQPPKATWWLKQSVIYFMGLLGMKICVLIAIRTLPFIVEIGDWALRWTEGNTGVQIFFVMLLFPVTMNAIQYYIIDTLIKKPISSQYAPANEDDEVAVTDDRHRRSAFLAAMDDSDSSESDNGLGTKLDNGNGESRRSSLSGGSSTEYYRADSSSNHIPSISTGSENSNKSNVEDRHSPSVKLTARRTH